MSRPPHVPEAGDVPPSKVAVRLGLADVRELNDKLPHLLARGFPRPDPDTGNFCIEAVDRWRRRRHPDLFPELTVLPEARDASVARQRIAERRANGHREDPLLRGP
jgi:hypothetical protein